MASARVLGKAAVIGHTGRENFGHNLDVIFNDRPGAEVSPPPIPIRPDARRRGSGCRRTTGYTDFPEMREKERPQLRSDGDEIAVAHQLRDSSAPLLLKRRLAEGIIGELREIRARGK